MTRCSMCCLGVAAMLACTAIGGAAAGQPGYNKSDDVVARLYRDYSWEAVMDVDWPKAALIEQPREVLSRYFDEGLVRLFLADRACVKRTGEMCSLEFDPIFASQDPGASELKVAPADASGRVRVEFIYPSTHERISLTYRVVRTARGWRISDIEYRDGPSLKTLLRQRP